MKSQVPSGYVLLDAAYGVKLVVGQTASKNLTDKEQKGALTIYKEGEVLYWATVTEDGVTFAYEKRELRGAVYRSVYAGADIKAADGTLIIKKGALVKDNLVTGDDGSGYVKGSLSWHPHSNRDEARIIMYAKESLRLLSLCMHTQTVEVQTVSATFLNERQKAQSCGKAGRRDKKSALRRSIYGLYAAEDIKVDGKARCSQRNPDRKSNDRSRWKSFL